MEAVLTRTPRAELDAARQTGHISYVTTLPNYDVVVPVIARVASSVGEGLSANFFGARRLVVGVGRTSVGSQLFEVYRGATEASGLIFAPITADLDAVVERVQAALVMRVKIEERLTALSRLEDGWLDGEGLPPTPAAVAAARNVIPHLLNSKVPRPRLAPTAEGGVEAEWSIGEREVSITFEPDGTLYCHALDFATHRDAELETRADDLSGIAAFVLGRNE